MVSSPIRLQTDSHVNQPSGLSYELPRGCMGCSKITVGTHQSARPILSALRTAGHPAVAAGGQRGCGSTMGGVERRPRLSASSISFRETPELHSTPPAGSTQFAHAARNVPTPPGILSGSPTTSPARGGTVSRARAMARTESQASEERRSTQSQSTLDLVNNMKKLRSASPRACSTRLSEVTSSNA